MSLRNCLNTLIKLVVVFLFVVEYVIVYSSFCPPIGLDSTLFKTYAYAFLVFILINNKHANFDLLKNMSPMNPPGIREYVLN